jgi:hypothetical protein
VVPEANVRRRDVVQALTYRLFCVEIFTKVDGIWTVESKQKYLRSEFGNIASIKKNISLNVESDDSPDTRGISQGCFD